MSRVAALRHWAVKSPHPVAATLRRLRRSWSRFTLPAPRIIVVPMLWVFIAIRAVVFFLRSKLIAEPLLKAYCTRHGRGVTADIYVPWVTGRGELILGDYVRIDGKISINFAASFTAHPRLEIGEGTDIAHDTKFVVGREIRIGRYVQVAGGVTFRDSGGHASDPVLRQAGAPPDPSEVRPIVVHDNVWIGAGAMLLPGAEIGEGSIVAARSIVSGVVAPYTIVAGSPARRVGTLNRPGEAAAASAGPTDKPADPAAQPRPSVTDHSTATPTS